MAESRWAQDILGCCDDPCVCITTWCCPSVQYGLNASKVHGGGCCNHCCTYYMASCCMLQGLYAGPTRKAMRDHFRLPQVPTSMGQVAPSDFLVHTIGCMALLALCQEARELKVRGLSSSLVRPFDPFDQSPYIAPKGEVMTA